MVFRRGSSSLYLTRIWLRPLASLASGNPGLISYRSVFALAIVELKDGKLIQSSLSAVSAAQKLGSSITGFIAGGNISESTRKTAKIISIEDNAYDKALANIRKGGFNHILAGHTTFGKSMMPRVAALLDVAQISDITAIENENTFVRPMYAGNAIATIESSDEIKFITTRATAFPPAEYEAEGREVLIENGVDPNPDFPIQLISENLTKLDRPNLATAGKVVSGGRGLKSKEEFDRVILPLADAFGAAVGASRAAVDSGYADNSLQVGQTGQVVAPQLYFCVGISGAIQHLAGIKMSMLLYSRSLTLGSSETYSIQCPNSPRSLRNNFHGYLKNGVIESC
ncbi:electron transfer flavoprotein subunit [Blumeria hordei DH14]|uniref:Probable electron transfer flavoprotein subunit alpha, mitochondrial n=1 Tax=Blumeria graminis f. sp. hordei (strain DH14) TaxID=546991 RepID=N1J5R9_BLUG1|nr:electron transfer flavoprotein subunit [Blumeria hordei DH14]